MKKYILVLLMFINLAGYAQVTKQHVNFISIDSLPNLLTEKWCFSNFDSDSFSMLGYADSGWQVVRSDLTYYKAPSNCFRKPLWLRYHFVIDSTLTKIPLAFSVKHFGASEIYLDGKLLKKYGVISDSANSVYYNPQELPYTFTISNAGEHLFAVRYTNYEASKNFDFFKQSFGGFNLIIGTSESLIEKRDYKSIVVTIILIALVGIFSILSLLHLFLFLFYSKNKSNLYFSLFMISLTCLTVAGYLSLMSTHPNLQLKSQYLVSYIFCIGCFSLSLFVNDLFSKKKGLRFKLIALLVVFTIILRILGNQIYAVSSLALLIIVSFETAIIIIHAIIKRIKGARIIGVGILFFSLFFIVIFLMLVGSGGDFDVDDSTTIGQLILLIAGMAILSVPISMSVYLAWNFATINKNLGLQLDEIKHLSQKNLEQEQEKVKIISGQNEMLEQKVEERTKELKEEKKKSDDLLRNILPDEIAEELKQNGKSEAQLYDHVTVLFTDFVSFTSISERLTPKELVDEINHFFTAFDAIIEKNGLEKIKTIGDAYMAVCGMPINDDSHAIKVVKAAIDIIEFVKNRKNNDGGEFDIRIGINSGPVVAGIVGIKKFAYDIWGDTVNTAARMEQNSEPGRINISGSTFELIKEQFKCNYRGKINAKNKGEIDMYFVNENGF